ncbi:hypothetical protein K2X33_02305 [bacterium]|nr:hypothetical protein [bacterium]
MKYRPLGIWLIPLLFSMGVSAKCKNPFDPKGEHSPAIQDLARWEAALKLTSFLGVQLAKSTVAEVDSALGIKGNWATVKPRGDHEGYRACFTGKDGAPTLRFSKSGLDETIVLLEVFSKGSKTPKNCVVSPKFDSKTVLADELKLGMTSDSVKKLLGAPSCEDDMRVLYKFENAAPSATKSPLKEYGTVILDFRLTKGAVHEMTLWKWIEVSE